MPPSADSTNMRTLAIGGISLGHCEREARSNVIGATYCVHMHPQATVDKAITLSRQGLYDRQVAQITGVPLSTVRKWRTGRRRASGADGRRKRACPRCDGVSLSEPAYSYLLGLYLGDGHIVRQRKGVFALSIFCCDAWPGLLEAASMPCRTYFRRPRYSPSSESE
jgi:hypothetical protein